MQGRENKLFLKKDLTELQKTLDVYARRLKQSALEAGEACRQSSETFHDNFPYEQSMRDIGMNARRVKEIESILKQAIIVSPPTSAESVQLGTIVKVLNGETDEIAFLEIGSFIIPDHLNKEADGKNPQLPMRISYNSPLGQCLLGARPYDARVLHSKSLGKKEGGQIIYTVFEIFVPETPTEK